MAQREARQTTSQVGLLHKPSIVALIHGLNRHYYSIAMTYRAPIEEQSALKCIEKRVGVPVGRSDLNAMLPVDRKDFQKQSLELLGDMSKWSALLAKRLVTLSKTTEKSGDEAKKVEEKKIEEKPSVGQRDPRRHLDECSEALNSLSMLQTLSTSMLQNIC